MAHKSESVRWRGWGVALLLCLMVQIAASLGCPGPEGAPATPAAPSSPGKTLGTSPEVAPLPEPVSKTPEPPVAQEPAIDAAAEEEMAGQAETGPVPSASEPQGEDPAGGAEPMIETSAREPGVSPETPEPSGAEEAAVPEVSAPMSAATETSDDGEVPRSAATQDEAFAEAPQEYEGWGEPALVFLISGRQNGYIEPCGCTGLANQKGGLLRRDTLLSELKARGWNVVPIDLGNQERRFGAQATIKFGRSVETLVSIMDYQAIGLGPDDLRLPSTDLVQSIENAGAAENRFVSADIALFGDYLPRLQIIESHGKRIGVTAIMGRKARTTVSNSDVELLDVNESLASVAKELAAANCDLKVLLAYADGDEIQELMTKHPEFDFVVAPGADGEPPMIPETVAGVGRRLPVVHTGVKGMYVGVVGWFPGSETPLRYQRVALDARFEDSPRVATLFRQYQEQLESLGLEGLELRPVAHPSGRTFVGSNACADCHTTAFDVWKNGVDGEGGPHAHATVSLVEPGERTWVKRFHDPECLSCHTTGWNPQKYFPYEGGYVDLEASVDLHGNGCENCHGPGSRHVAAEQGDLTATEEELKQFQLEMRVKLDATLCMECHDLDNSPDFHEPGAFEKYWSRIVHEGKD